MFDKYLQSEKSLALRNNFIAVFNDEELEKLENRKNELPENSQIIVDEAKSKKEEMNKIQSDISQVEENIEKLKSENSELEGQISMKRGELSEITKKLENLNSDVEKLRKEEQEICDQISETTKLLDEKTKELEELKTSVENKNTQKSDIEAKVNDIGKEAKDITDSQDNPEASTPDNRPNVEVLPPEQSEDPVPPEESSELIKSLAKDLTEEQQKELQRNITRDKLVNLKLYLEKVIEHIVELDDELKEDNQELMEVIDQIKQSEKFKDVQQAVVDKLTDMIQSLRNIQDREGIDTTNEQKIIEENIEKAKSSGDTVELAKINSSNQDSEPDTAIAGSPKRREILLKNKGMKITFTPSLKEDPEQPANESDLMEVYERIQAAISQLYEIEGKENNFNDALVKAKLQEEKLKENIILSKERLSEISKAIGNMANKVRHDAEQVENMGHIKEMMEAICNQVESIESEDSNEIKENIKSTVLAFTEKLKTASSLKAGKEDLTKAHVNTNLDDGAGTEVDNTQDRKLRRMDTEARQRLLEAHNYTIKVYQDDLAPSDIKEEDVEEAITLLRESLLRQHNSVKELKNVMSRLTDARMVREKLEDNVAMLNDEKADAVDKWYDVLSEIEKMQETIKGMKLHLKDKKIATPAGLSKQGQDKLKSDDLELSESEADKDSKVGMSPGAESVNWSATVGNDQSIPNTPVRDTSEHLINTLDNFSKSASIIPALSHDKLSLVRGALVKALDLTKKGMPTSKDQNEQAMFESIPAVTSEETKDVTTKERVETILDHLAHFLKGAEEIPAMDHSQMLKIHQALLEVAKKANVELEIKDTRTQASKTFSTQENESNKEIDNLKEQLQRATEELTRVSKESDAKKQQFFEKNKQIDDLTKKIEDLKSEITSLQEQIHKMKVDHQPQEQTPTEEYFVFAKEAWFAYMDSSVQLIESLHYLNCKSKEPSQMESTIDNLYKRHEDNAETIFNKGTSVGEYRAILQTEIQLQADIQTAVQKIAQ